MLSLSGVVYLVLLLLLLAVHNRSLSLDETRKEVGAERLLLLLLLLYTRNNIQDERVPTGYWDTRPKND